MKSQKLLLSFFMMLLIVGTSQKMFSQHSGCQGSKVEKCQPDMPGMTDELKAKIEKLHMTNMKEVMPLKNELKEKKAKMHSLMTSDKVDIAEINKVIDEMGAIEVNIEKKHAFMVQEIRKILTEDQRLFFDLHCCKMKDCRGKGDGQNCCPGGAGMSNKAGCHGGQGLNPQDEPMQKSCPHSTK